MTDMRGIQIKVGDPIVYPGRRGSAMWLNTGTVEAIIEGETSWCGRPRKPGSLKVRRMPLDKYETARIVNVRGTSRVAVVR